MQSLVHLDLLGERAIGDGLEFGEPVGLSRVPGLGRRVGLHRTSFRRSDGLDVSHATAWHPLRLR